MHNFLPEVIQYEFLLTDLYVAINFCLEMRFWHFRLETICRIAYAISAAPLPNHKDIKRLSEPTSPQIWMRVSVGKP